MDSYLRISMFLLMIFAAIFPIQTASADVFSVNSGGSTNISVTSDKYIEGYYPELGICGDGFVEPANDEQCDDGNTVSGDSCSATCQTEAAEPPADGGGGGGGVPAANISVSPTELNVNLALDARVERTIIVTNLGASQIVVTASQQGLGNVMVIPNSTLTIPAGQTVNLNVIFVSLDNQTGIFTGTINIGGKTVLVSLNVRTQLLLFDSNIVVLNEFFEVPQRKKLRTLVTLIPLGDPERLDVILNFVIKDYRNQVYLTKSETLLVDRQMQLLRDFDTGNLPLGDYVVGLELVYPNGVAPSSASFKVVESRGGVILFIIIAILIISIIIVARLIFKNLKERKLKSASQART